MRDSARIACLHTLLAVAPPCRYLDDLVRRWRDGQYSLVHAVDLNCRITAALITNPTGSITTNPLEEATGTFRNNGPMVIPITVPADIGGGKLRVCRWGWKWGWGGGGEVRVAVWLPVAVTIECANVFFYWG